MRIALLPAALAVIAVAGCGSVKARSAQVENLPAPGLPAASYKLIGKVEGVGEASVISPSVAALITGDPMVTAKNSALGAAIYDRDDVDMVIAPKWEYDLQDYGILIMGKVTVKGQGVQLTGPK